jgi:hypothetical protein
VKSKFIAVTAAFLLSSSMSALAVSVANGEQTKAVNADTATTKTTSNSSVKKHGISKRHKHRKHRRHHGAYGAYNDSNDNALEQPGRNDNSISYRINAFEQQIYDLQGQVNELRKKEGLPVTLTPAKRQSFLDQFQVFAHGPAVVTSPFLGGVPNYSGFDLLTNMPSINEDASLLRVRKQVEDFYAKYNIPIPQRPILAISGEVEGLATYANSKDFYENKSNSTFDLNTAKLEFFGEISKWISAVIGLSYDHTPPNFGARVTNARVYLDRGYLTVGNFNTYPVYFSVGQFYVPFGVYASNLISSPITETLFKTRARAALLGIRDGGFYAALYGFQGDTYDPSTRKNGGANIGYAYTSSNNKLIVDVGGGYINNVTDSLGMQDTSNNLFHQSAVGVAGPFGGYAFDSGNKGVTEHIHDNVNAYDAHVSLTYDAFNIFSEFIGTLKQFNVADLMYNHRGARPQAFDIEANYNFNAWSKPSYFSIGYDRSWQALALNVPWQSYFAVLGTSLFKSTVQSIEYRHDINYKNSSVASGNAGNDPNFIIHGGGKGDPRNMVTANFKVFF